MEKPPLEKIIEKLERLDARQWAWDTSDYRDPYLIAKISGIKFFICKTKDEGLFKKYYHYLHVRAWEGETQFEYSGKNNDFEEDKISSFYERLHGRLSAHRIVKFYEMLYEFIEQTVCKVDKKPELEKVIKKLEQLDIKQWIYRTWLGYENFTTEANGLTFQLSKDKDFHMFKGPLTYLKLIIKNKEESKKVEYSNKDKNSFEEKELTRLYDQLYQSYQPLITDKKAEFEHMLNSFLQD